MFLILLQNCKSLFFSSRLSILGFIFVILSQAKANQHRPRVASRTHPSPQYARSFLLSPCVFLGRSFELFVVLVVGSVVRLLGNVSLDRTDDFDREVLITYLSLRFSNRHPKSPPRSRPACRQPSRSEPKISNVYPTVKPSTLSTEKLLSYPRKPVSADIDKYRKRVLPAAKTTVFRRVGRSPGCGPRSLDADVGVGPLVHINEVLYPKGKSRPAPGPLDGSNISTDCAFVTFRFQSFFVDFFQGRMKISRKSTQHGFKWLVLLP